MVEIAIKFSPCGFIWAYGTEYLKNVPKILLLLFRFGQDISFTQRGRGLTAVGVLVFDKTISVHQSVFRENNKSVNY